MTLAPAGDRLRLPRAALLMYLVAWGLLPTAGCSFVFGDDKYVSNDSGFPFDTGPGDSGDSGDSGDASDGHVDGATGCTVMPELCTEGTRCAADGSCVPCDADADGAQAPDPSCDALAGEAPRDCDDDDGAVYPGASPVCGDGRFNGCSPGPESFREALGVREIGALPTSTLAPLPRELDLSSLALEVTAQAGGVPPRVLVAWASEDGRARLSSLDAAELTELHPEVIVASGEVLAVALRRGEPASAHLVYLSTDGSGDAVLSRAVYDSTRPPTEDLVITNYAFDDSPCVSAAEAANLDGDLSLDGAGGAVWRVAVADEMVYAPTTGGVACVSLPGSHRGAGTDGPVVGLVDPTTGTRRSFRGVAGEVDLLDAVGPGSVMHERPGYAFLRAAARDLYLTATVTDEGRTRVAPLACTTGASCMLDDGAAVTFAPAPDVELTFGAALDGLVGDFAALVQVEERGAAPAPADRGQDVVLRLIEHPATAVGGTGAPAPGETIVLYRHAFVGADRDHTEVREVDVATVRDPATGDLSVYWAALLGDRRLLPGSPEDPNADNEVRVGGVHMCVRE